MIVCCADNESVVMPNKGLRAVIGWIAVQLRANSRLTVTYRFQIVEAPYGLTLFGDLRSNQDQADLSLQKVVLALIGDAEHQRWNTVPIADNRKAVASTAVNNEGHGAVIEK